MTGGVGFSRQGKESFKNNRKLLNKRTSMKDNPYVATNHAKRETVPVNSPELQEWRDKKQKREKKLRIIIFGFLIPLVVLVALLTAVLLG